jgi:transglutaminase superfamily protein
MKYQYQNIIASARVNNQVATDYRGVGYTTRNIIDAVLRNDAASAGSAIGAAALFRGMSVAETCYNIWDWLKNAVTYQIDDDGSQVVSTFGKLATQPNSGPGRDCKSFASATAGILRNLGIPYHYVFCTYEQMGDDGKIFIPDSPTHVYIEAYDETGNIIPIDAVWEGRALTRKLPEYKRTVMKPGIYRISGTGAAVASPAPNNNNNTAGTLIIVGLAALALYAIFS